MVAQAQRIGGQEERGDILLSKDMSKRVRKEGSESGEGNCGLCRTVYSQLTRAGQ